MILTKLSGLGRSMARALAINGASKVFIVGRRLEALQETAALGPQGTIIPVTGDISSKESLQAAYDTIASQTRHVDLLLANSGALGPTARPPTKPDGSKPDLSEVREELWSLPMEDFSSVLHTNVAGTYFTVIAFLPLLEAANKRHAPAPNTPAPPKAQVIITSSIAGFIRLVPVGFPYRLSKAAVTHLIKMLSTVLSSYDIRVNGVAPGLYMSEMASPMYEGRGSGVSDGSFPQQMIPLSRGGKEEEIAGLILFMSSTAGGYLNGSIIVTDGGRLSVLPSAY